MNIKKPVTSTLALAMLDFNEQKRVDIANYMHC